ncbi:hypothetical protein [Alteribacillus sp. HJP-4]|uniref:hypothetical protein n=1 Tax=Alteribacillus sp. HJP-4 TaxID=2775394 RepID=UPI0035CCE1C4
MWKVLFVITAAILIAIIEVPALSKKKWKKEMWVFGLLLATGTILAVLFALDVQLPTPMDYIASLYKPLSDLVKNWLG